MLSPSTGLIRRNASSNWIRLRTLVLLRWMAVSGQLAAILVAQFWLGMDLPLGALFIVAGASVIANIIAIFLYPQTRRLSERGAMVMLLFDLAQLAVLLCLTGGLNNPFALLIVAPVTIAATALTLRSTVFMGSLTILMTSAVAFLHLPLRTGSGDILSVPPVFEFGFWLSIVIGVVFLAVYSRRVSGEIRNMAEALLAAQMALAREQKLTDLGGVVAAAAHELGTPLATIKLVSAELIEELSGCPDLAELREDAELIRSQVERCRTILRSMGRAGKDDLHLRHAPLETVLREAAEPHAARGKILQMDIRATDGADPRQPQILRAPEIIHGLRNLIQNAVDFADDTVWIDGHWNAQTVSIRIIDNGPGYPPHLLGRIGDPFLRSRSEPGPVSSNRQEYEGMGLGLFIAKTLLERSGAELSFANGGDPFLKRSEKPLRSGAIVEVIWPRERIAVAPGASLGENVPFED